MTLVFIGKDMQCIEKYLKGINIILKGMFYYLELCDLFLVWGEGYRSSLMTGIFRGKYNGKDNSRINVLVFKIVKFRTLVKIYLSKSDDYKCSLQYTILWLKYLTLKTCSKEKYYKDKI